MAAINDLINQIQDPALRDRIQKEVNKLAKQKKFGLVFEEHMPECTPLYDMPIKTGSTVAKKAGPVNDIYKVLRITDGVAACLHKESQETCTINGKPLKGTYFGSDIPMATGFKANAAFFQLSFVDNTAVSLGMAFKEMLPILWMKAGAVGKCPTVEESSIPNMLVLPENKFAILINENAFAPFEEELSRYPEIQTVFLATDYDITYRTMVKNLNVRNTCQLYRDYLDHFRLHRGRN